MPTPLAAETFTASASSRAYLQRVQAAQRQAVAELHRALPQAQVSRRFQIVVDGPLSQHRHMSGALGYVKTLQRGYGPPDVLRVAGELGPGERTPL